MLVKIVYSDFSTMHHGSYLYLVELTDIFTFTLFAVVVGLAVDEDFLLCVIFLQLFLFLLEQFML